MKIRIDFPQTKKYTTIAQKLCVETAVKPDNIVQCAQNALRVLYHDAHDDGGNVTKFYLSDRIQIAFEFLTAILRVAEKNNKAELTDGVANRLTELYNVGFSDGVEKTGAGWANATIIRLQIANLLEKDGFKITAERLRMNICDNLAGNY